jgi:Kef-type K+ transport system membrane component KefB
VFLGLLFVPIFILGAVLLIKAPKLLNKRLENKEKETVQKGVVALSAIIFLLGFVDIEVHIFGDTVSQKKIYTFAHIDKEKI